MHKVFSWISPRIAALSVAMLIASPAFGAEIQITVTNDQPAGGFSLAPVWVGVQNSSTFSVFTPGSAASSQIATLAQFGNTTPLSNLFAGTGPETTVTSGGSLVQFLPGQSNSATLAINNPAVDQYLSYAGMIVPSNDFFQGNAAPVQIFDSSGNFVGPITIQVYADQIWDSDTEQQSITTGLTFIQGQTPGSGMQISDGSVMTLLSEPGGSAFLNNINGLETAANYTISNLGGSTLVDTITISSVPEPASVVMLGLGMAGILVFGRKLRSRKAGRTG